MPYPSCTSLLDTTEAVARGFLASSPVANATYSVFARLVDGRRIGVPGLCGKESTMYFLQSTCHERRANKTRNLTIGCFSGMSDRTGTWVGQFRAAMAQGIVRVQRDFLYEIGCLHPFLMWL